MRPRFTEGWIFFGIESKRSIDWICDLRGPMYGALSHSKPPKGAACFFLSGGLYWLLKKSKSRRRTSGG